MTDKCGLPSLKLKAGGENRAPNADQQLSRTTRPHCCWIFPFVIVCCCVWEQRLLMYITGYWFSLLFSFKRPLQRGRVSNRTHEVLWKVWNKFTPRMFLNTLLITHFHYWNDLVVEAQSSIRVVITLQQLLLLLLLLLPLQILCCQLQP